MLGREGEPGGRLECCHVGGGGVQSDCGHPSVLQAHLGEPWLWRLVVVGRGRDRGRGWEHVGGLADLVLGGLGTSVRGGLVRCLAGGNYVVRRMDHYLVVLSKIEISDMMRSRWFDCIWSGLLVLVSLIVIQVCKFTLADRINPHVRRRYTKVHCVKISLGYIE